MFKRLLFQATCQLSRGAEIGSGPHRLQVLITVTVTLKNPSVARAPRVLLPCRGLVRGALPTTTREPVFVAALWNSPLATTAYAPTDWDRVVWVAVTLGAAATQASLWALAAPQATVGRPRGPWGPLASDRPLGCSCSAGGGDPMACGVDSGDPMVFSDGSGPHWIQRCGGLRRYPWVAVMKWTPATSSPQATAARLQRAVVLGVYR